MLSFGKKHWTEEIAEVTGASEYQTCEFELIDPSQIDSEYDIETGTWTETGDGVIYSGQARLIAVNRGVSYEGSLQGNSKTLTAIRVQFPAGVLPQSVRKGSIGNVLSAPRNPTLESYVFYLSSDVHGSSAATRTLEFNLDGDSR